MKRHKKKSGFSIPWLSKKTSSSPVRRKKPAPVSWGRRLLQLLVVVFVVSVFGGIAVGFVYLERYVRSLPVVAERTGPLELVGPPDWISNELQDKIVQAAGGRSFSLDQSQSRKISERLEQLAWIYGVSVQTTDKTLRIEAGYRKPTAMIESGGKKYYLVRVEREDPLFSDTEQRVLLLDYVPVEKLLLPKITGFASKPPTQSGELWHSSEIISVIELLTALGRMDRISTPEKPLLAELDRIDIANHAGRKNSSSVHTILYAKDGTEVWWGAAYGESQRYLEATEQEKIASLYTFYNRYGTIRGIDRGVGQIIDLRSPQKMFPRPLN
jgi:hypothetical protein